MSAHAVHRVWKTISARDPLPAMLAGPLLSFRGARSRRRLTALLPHAPQSSPARLRVPEPTAGPGGGASRRPVREAAFAAGAGATAIIFIGGMAGFFAGLAVAFAVWRWLRQHTDPAATAAATEQRETSEQLPLAAALLTACLAAGSGPQQAAHAVGKSIGGPLGKRLVRASDELRLGADPSTAWARIADVPEVAGLARCLERAHRSGAPAIESVSRLADRCRADRGRAAAARARRAGVLVTAPLGLCFLPAFLLVGVVPVIIGLGRSLL